MSRRRNRQGTGGPWPSYPFKYTFRGGMEEVEKFSQNFRHADTRAHFGIGPLTFIVLVGVVLGAAAAVGLLWVGLGVLVGG